MSDIYGYERGIQYNNDIMSRNTQLQQSIADSNKQTLDEYRTRNQENTAIAKGIEGTAERSESAKEEQKGEEGAGEFLADARNVYKVGGAVRKEISNVNNAVKSYRRANFINEGGGIDPTGDQTGRMTGQVARRELDLGSDLTEVADDTARGGTAISRGADLSGVLRYGGDALQNTLQGSARGIGEAFTGTRSAIQSGTQALQDTAEASRLGDTAGMVEGAGRVVSSAKSGLSALDSIGKTAEGLNVVSGVSDIMDDMDGGFKKMNTAEKVGNVAGIVSGGLEGLGTALDLTGVGAPVGVALNLLGGLTSLAGAGADIVGEEEEKKSAQDKVKQVVSQQPQLAQQEAIKVGGDTGAEIK